MGRGRSDGSRDAFAPIRQSRLPSLLQTSLAESSRLKPLLQRHALGKLRHRGYTRKTATRTRSTNAPCPRSEEHTSELPSLMRISYAVFCLKKKTTQNPNTKPNSKYTNITK